MAVREIKRSEDVSANALSDAKKARPINEYYLSVAKKYGIAKYVSILILAVFLIYAVAAYGTNLTYDNLLFLIKDFGTESTGKGSVFETVRFEGSEEGQYGMYAGELCVLGSSGISLYSKSGTKTLNYQTSYSDPVMAISKKYVLVYGVGEKEYSLYTSLARVVSRSVDHTIVGGAVSDSGAYALVTRSSTSKFKVNVYSQSFSLVWTYYKDSYVADIALSADGKNVAVVSYDISGYDFVTEVSLCSVKSDKPVNTVMLADLFPYKVGYLDSGSFYVIADSAVLFFDENGTQTGRFDYGGMTVKRADSAGDYVALALTPDGVGRTEYVFIVDKNGRQVYRSEVADGVKDVSLSDDGSLYILTPSSVIRVTGELVRETREYDGDAVAIIALDGYALAIGETKAESVFTSVEGGK